jgi:DNA-binding MarR family transcriptional regulator
MEKLGYIRRVPAPEGGRKVFIHLTPAGQALKDVLVPMALEMNEIAVRGLREADIAATRRTLLAMVANLAEDEIEAAKEDR